MDIPLPFLPLHFYYIFTSPSPLPSLIAKRYIVSVATHSVPRIHCLSHSVRLRSATAYLVWNLAWNNFHRLGELVLRNAISLKHEDTRHLLFKQTFVTTKFVSKTSTSTTTKINIELKIWIMNNSNWNSKIKKKNKSQLVYCSRNTSINAKLTWNYY